MNQYFLIKILFDSIRLALFVVIILVCLTFSTRNVFNIFKLFSKIVLQSKLFHLYTNAIVNKDIRK